MKNAEIILHKSMKLMKEGVLKGVHNYFHYTDEYGNTVYCQIPETIYSITEVVSHGWKIKEGVIPDERLCFPIWIKIGSKFVKEKTQFYRDDEIVKA